MNNIEEIEYCKYCGKEVRREAVFCPHCGSQLKPVQTEIVQKEIITPKSKITAILLAIIFGFWSWLYTYKLSYKKFWGSIMIFLGIGLFSICYSCSAIMEQEIIVPRINYNYVYLICFALAWLIPIIDYSIKPISFYKEYPRG